MRLHRFFIGSKLTDTVTLNDPDLIHQLTKVLRYQPGDHVILCDNKGTEAEAEIRAINPKIIECSVSERRRVTAEPDRSVTLYCALLKRENFEWVVQKATELGVKEIVPLITDRTIKTGMKQERLETIAREAAEQSGRGMIPVIHSPRSLAEAVKDARNPAMQIFFHCGETESLPKPLDDQKVGIWIGPEGGWSDEEVDEADERSFRMGSLGSLTLRAETAAIVASALVLTKTEHSH